MKRTGHKCYTLPPSLIPMSCLRLSEEAGGGGGVGVGVVVGGGGGGGNDKVKESFVSASWG